MQVIAHPSLPSAERLSVFNLKNNMVIFLFRQNAMNLHYVYTFSTKKWSNSNKVGKGHNLPLKKTVHLRKIYIFQLVLNRIFA